MSNFDWGVIVQFRSLLFDGLVATVELAAVSILISVTLGTIIGVPRALLASAYSWPLAWYTEFFRNIPPIVQLFFWYFAFGLDVFPASVIGLSVFTSAYVAEIMRAGIRAIPRTQMEAARSSGLSTLQMVAHIILPQAVIRVLPALGIEFINVVKNSAIAMTIGYTELTFQSQEIEARTFRGFEAATAVTVLYCLIAFAIIVMMHALERFARLELRRG